MSRIYNPLRRFLLWCSPEHRLAFFMLFFGSHTLVSWLLADRVHSPTAFATILPTGPGRHLETLYYIVIPLLGGSTSLFAGLISGKRRLALVGHLFGVFVFATALFSCILGNPLGTGAAVYTGVTCGVIFLLLCRSLCIEWRSFA